MLEVAIIGAGEIGGLLAHLLGRRGRAGSVPLLDDDGRVARGHALDIAQAAALVGVPPDRIVIGWEDGSVAGWAMTRVISEPVRRRLTEKISLLWPPGPFALASAASKVIEAAAGHSANATTCFVAPDESSGLRTRTAALPVKLGPSGVEVVLPPLGVAERVALDNAMLL